MRRLLLPLLSTVLAAALGTPLAAVVAAPAWAHTRLVSSTPAAGQTVAAPDQVVLVFSDAVQPGLSALSVTDAAGEEQTSGTPSAGGDGSSLVQALRSPLDPGAYRVAYRVLAADGHPVTGSFDVTATAPAAGAAPTTPAAVPAPEATTPGALQPVAGGQEQDPGPPVLPLVAAGLVVAGAAGLLARRLGGAPSRA